MTDAMELPAEPSVTGEWLTVERSTATKPEGVIATVVITSTADAPVGVRVREDLPDAWAVTAVAVHPDYEPPELTAGTDRIEFADVVYPDERRTFVYGVRVASTDGLEPLPDPVIVSERRLDDRRVDPSEGTDAEWSDGPLEVVPDVERATGGDLGDGAGPSEDGPDPDAGIDDRGRPTAADAQDDGTHASAWAGPLFGEDQPSGGDGQVSASEDDQVAADRNDEVSASEDDQMAADGVDEVSAGGGDQASTDEGDGVDPFELEDHPRDGALEPADDPATWSLSGEAEAGAGVDDPDGDVPAEAESSRPSAGGAVAGDGGLLKAPGAVLDGTANLLVLSDHDETDAGCARLVDRQLADGDELVLVTFVESADDRLQAVAEVTADPGDVDVLCMGDPHRSSTAADSTVPTPLGEATVTSIADSTDLFRLGVHVSRALDEAAGEPVICLHSLTALVGLVELQRVFRFIHVLSGRVRSADGRAHYHLDPSAVDEQTVRTIDHLFDAVVRLEDGHWVAE